MTEQYSMTSMPESRQQFPLGPSLRSTWYLRKLRTMKDFDLLTPEEALWGLGKLRDEFALSGEFNQEDSSSNNKKRQGGWWKQVSWKNRRLRQFCVVAGWSTSRLRGSVQCHEEFGGDRGCVAEKTRAEPGIDFIWYSPFPGLKVSVARLAQASFQQKECPCQLWHTNL